MDKIREHLEGRPIAPNLAACKEKDSVLALKLLCVIDYFIEKRKLNADIDAIPKMREQLLNWHSYESFRFYNYSASNWFTREILQCKRCEFIGPYLTTLIHMVSIEISLGSLLCKKKPNINSIVLLVRISQAVNHDLHIGLKKCAWCSRMNFQEHIAQNTVQECYEMYLAKEQIHNPDYPKVVVDFYDMIKTIAGALEVKICRKDSFAGIGYKSKDYLFDVDSDGDVDQSVTVFSMKRKYRKEINTLELNKLFRKAMEHFHRQDASKFYNALANEQCTVSLQNILSSSAGATRTAKCESTQSERMTSTPQTPSRTAPRTQAFATYVALEVDSIQSPDVQNRTKRLIQDVIANAQEEDKRDG